MRTVAQNAELALLLEVAGTPKPGNVDRHRDHDDLRFEHFLAGAVGARGGLDAAAAGEPLGESFRRAVEGMSEQRGGNTQFGALLLQMPLVAAAGADDRDLSPGGAAAVVESTTVADAANFYRAFEAVDVAVDDPPEEMAALDVRRGSDAVPALEDRGLTLADIMARSADRDGVAREWVEGFERTFGAAESIESGDPERPVADRAADAFLELLAAEVDTFVVTQHDRAAAERATERARAALDGDIDPEDLAEEFVAEGINPGTTADTVAAALFVALERGLEV
ncbi:triphosphoribosyl-dephospho-CoA synthase [Halosimplex pelagicum]|uniref:Triphosphoribosyl-dephospho-CoA synthase n=1 Tax=Halosimplex pelagicum TaxID=869886 RepID=A0A7D5PDJ0_9EURY|nr:triphosphoribosyl-dephospho-CoA synthase [Halosimplex pelagicum]QLH84545.1 triphosphoribosyl-dephospho-CoA synthase [Halosimplex pelagicum]